MERNSFETFAKLSFLRQKTRPMVCMMSFRGVIRGRELFFRSQCREGGVNRGGELFKVGGGGGVGVLIIRGNTVNWNAGYFTRMSARHDQTRLALFQSTINTR